MRYTCPIPPIAHPELATHGMGETVLVLAQLFNKSSIYRKAVEDYRQAGFYVIMDNGAAEGETLSRADYIRAVLTARPDEVVLPDTLLDGPDTIYRAREWLPILKAVMPDETRYMAVAQGRDEKSWLECYKELLTMEGVDRIGLSKISVPECWHERTANAVHVDSWIEPICTTRNVCVAYLEKNGLLVKPIHLLGMGSPREYTAYTHPLIEGTDSCYAILAAKLGQDFTVDAETRTPTPHTYFEQTLTDKEVQLAISNINIVNEFIQR